VVYSSNLQIDLKHRIKYATKNDETYKNLQEKLQNDSGEEESKFICNKDGLVLYKDIIYIPDSADLKKKILVEVHNKPYSYHRGYQKTITTLKKEHLWAIMKIEVVEYIARCLECQQVKFEHRHPVGLL
jgi:hypothetical protein